MPSTHDRLVLLFKEVFPSVDAATLTTASTKTMAEWDSLATVTLVSVIEDEFGVNLTLEELTELTSFPAVLAWLNASNAR